MLCKCSIKVNLIFQNTRKENYYTFSINNKNLEKLKQNKIRILAV